MSRFTQVTEYKDYTLHPNTEYAQEILVAGENQLQIALQKFSQVFLVHITLTFPAEVTLSPCTDNSCFQYFLENYIRYLAHRNYSPGYLWCREIGGQNHHLHYHLLLYLNGHNIQFFNLHEICSAKLYWGRALQRFFGWTDFTGCGAPIHIATDNFKVLRADYQTYLRAIQEKVGYLAKCRTKETSGRYIRNWGQSQMR